MIQPLLVSEILKPRQMLSKASPYFFNVHDILLPILDSFSCRRDVSHFAKYRYLFHNGERNGKVILNSYPGPDQQFFSHVNYF